VTAALGQSASVTDTGRRRRGNEDSFVHQPPLFAVADGVGGAQAGEVASQLTAAALKEAAAGGSGEERLVALIHEANRRVFERANEDAAASGMGTTITAALIDDGVVWFGHVGDSRAYLVRDGKLEQLTDDHTLVGELQRSGKLSPKEAKVHPQRSVITRALGSDPDVDVDSFPIEPRAGDVFLLCSDGLTDMVDDATILETIERRRGDLEGAARELVNLANRLGGEDNITVVAFEISDEEPPTLAETARYPAPAAEQPEPDEEDTLSGIEQVRAVDTMIVPPAEARKMLPVSEPAVEEEPVHRPSFLRRVFGWLLVAAVAAVAAYLVWRLVH
jgi:serine/threonine protein phosphatase PrpC